jgi:sulfatase maturation enzyme AslB (radical SAM superfamily)
MGCPYCYIPFIGGTVDEHVCEAIAQRVAQLGFRVITVGGGDPLIYSWAPELIRMLKDLQLFVHLDTNAIRLLPNEKNKTMVTDHIDLLGLPLDGPTAAIHNRMRDSKGHFQILMRRFSWLSKLGTPIKINTVVSLINYKYLSEMARLIAQFQPIRWSLYQYMPLSLDASARAGYHLTVEQFTTATRPLQALVPDIRVEINDAGTRRLTYPFVDHTGRLYTHDEVDTTRYLDIGSIFDEAAASKAIAMCTEERASAQERYVS